MNLQTFEQLCKTFSDWAWGYHLLILLTGGGFGLMLYSRLRPFFYFKHAIDILRGKYHDADAVGEISPLEAMSSAIAATVGMGNISGVAVAIMIGGPGALFWMWVSAVVGMATKFFTCSLAVMYKGKDNLGNVQGGTMYFIMEGLGKKWKPAAVLFAFCGMFGMLPMFQANQLTEIIREVVLLPQGFSNTKDHFNTDLLTGIFLVALVSVVIFGGIKRIADVASKLVPTMVILYGAAVSYIIFVNIEQVPSVITLVFTDAFEGAFYKGDYSGILGGALGAMIITGIKRAAFSNEAGIGTATLAHGAAKNNEPIREGLIAMFEPFIDTVIVCSMTAIAILVTGVWQSPELANSKGVVITLAAFKQSMPLIGNYVLSVCAFIFSITTLFTYSYFGTKCLGFLIGAQHQKYYNYFYVSSIVLGAVASIDSVIGLIDGMYAVMAIPNMVATIILAPKVWEAAKIYFAKYR